MKNLYIPLDSRSVISITGKDSASFLQGLVTNDVQLASDTNSIYALMLTPQGKFLYDFFISRQGECYFLDILEKRKAEIIKKLSMYKLRSDVSITDESEKYEVVALLGDAIDTEIESPELGKIRQFCKGLVYIDPRNMKLFGRAIVEKDNQYQAFISHSFDKGSISIYEELRIRNTIPASDVDMKSGDAFPHEFNMNELNAISYRKGCYVGQEVTARVHHKGTIRKKIYTIESDAELDTGDEILSGNLKAGSVLSTYKNIALAQIKTDSDGNNLTDLNTNNHKVTILK